jgi:hypothetical protein
MAVFPEDRENPKFRSSEQTWYLMQHIPASGRIQTEYLDLEKKKFKLLTKKTESLNLEIVKTRTLQ